MGFVLSFRVLVLVFGVFVFGLGTVMGMLGGFVFVVGFWMVAVAVAVAIAIAIVFLGGRLTSLTFTVFILMILALSLG